MPRRRRFTNHLCSFLQEQDRLLHRSDREHLPVNTKWPVMTPSTLTPRPHRRSVEIGGTLPPRARTEDQTMNRPRTAININLPMDIKCQYPNRLNLLVPDRHYIIPTLRLYPPIPLTHLHHTTLRSPNIKLPIPTSPNSPTGSRPSVLKDLRRRLRRLERVTGKRSSGG